ncbi:xanthine dehydrogenase family protein [Mycobacterium yunnanensis]|uniref:Xanthine dehydrogenase family protein n=1 Tax=Mycobacterium yunnanensis TaxID=368477 RepID=A0A9X2Z3G8_9MYCO|nr:xanthine dehydrogenase family protein molybdopterin-binding subunit [Mycobacterium yunnanensis]MCV7422130.1 xanthine dehydrogenase family protein [Mycobacterium yunnanensis]
MSTSTQATWPKRNAQDFVVGRAEFVDDLRVPGMLHMAVVRSTRAHARLLAVDATRAASRSGVVRVLEGREASATLATLPYQFGVPELLGAESRPLTALPTDVVRYVGEPIAVVAAENPRAARAAAAAVTVRYDDLPALFDVRHLLGVEHLNAADAVRLIAENHFRSGEPEGALQRAPHVLDATFSVGRSGAAPLETRGYLADWDEESGRLTVHASHQQPFQLRTELAEVLGMSPTAIRVVVANVGGSFGLKMTGQVEEPLVCLMSMLCRRPVKWIETRSETMLGGAREQVHRVRVGFGEDGRVTTLLDDMVVPVGARSVSPGWRQAYVSAASLPTAYDVPHVDARSRVLETNLPPWHACRGFGKEAPTFVMERVMDLVARRLRLDPVDVRRRNLLQTSAFPHRMPSGYQIDSGDFEAVLDKVLDLADYPAAKTAVVAKSGPRRRGVGVAFEITPEGGGHAAGKMGPGVIPTVAASENATVRVDRNGHVTVLSGVTNPGGGNDTALARLAATELGTTPDRVTVIQGDTDLCPPGTGNASSRGAAVGGAAVVLAARQLADQLRKVAASEFGGAPADVTFVDGAVRVAGGAPVVLADVCRLALRSSGADWLESTHGYRPTPPEDPTFRDSYPYFSSGAYVAEVEVDRDTGIVRVLKLTAVHDCGRVLEPVLVEGQLQGAMAMGVGLALFEQSRFDGGGASATRTFKEYLIPRANDLPDFIIGHYETPAPYTLLGAKGAGEAGVGGALAAVANAVDDALQRNGDAVAPVTSIPLTPPAVLALTADSRGAP